jgi:hypothetical protein
MENFWSFAPQLMHSINSKMAVAGVTGILIQHTGGSIVNDLIAVAVALPWQVV